MPPPSARLAVVVGAVLGVTLLLTITPSSAADPRFARAGSPRIPLPTLPADAGASADPSGSPTPAPTPIPTNPLPDCHPDPLASLDPGLRSPEPGASVPVEASGSPSPTPKPTPGLTLKPTPRPDDSEDLARYKIREVKIRLDLPSDWIGLNADDLTALDDLPVVDEWLTYLQGSALVFEGVDVLPGDGCHVGTNMSVLDLGGDMPKLAIQVLAEAVQLSLASVDEVQGEVDLEMIELPAGDAARLRFRYVTSSTEVPVELIVEGDIIAIGDHTLLVAFSTPDTQAEGAYMGFARIARSIHKL
jgi:hypothetical protein